MEQTYGYSAEYIFRVMCVDGTRTSPETHWTKNRKECEEYIEKSYYKHLLYIEQSLLTDKIARRC